MTWRNPEDLIWLDKWNCHFRVLRSLWGVILSGTAMVRSWAVMQARRPGPTTCLRPFLPAYAFSGHQTKSKVKWILMRVSIAGKENTVCTQPFSWAQFFGSTDGCFKCMKKPLLPLEIAISNPSSSPSYQFISKNSWQKLKWRCEFLFFLWQWWELWSNLILPWGWQCSSRKQLLRVQFPLVLDVGLWLVADPIESQEGPTFQRAEKNPQEGFKD